MATTRNGLKIHSVEKHYEPNRPNNAKTVWYTFIRDATHPSLAK